MHCTLAPISLNGQQGAQPERRLRICPSRAEARHRSIYSDPMLAAFAFVQYARGQARDELMQQRSGVHRGPRRRRHVSD